MGKTDNQAKNMTHTENSKPDAQSTLRSLIESLHLQTLPNASKVNLACTAMLLIGLLLIVAEPVLAGINNIIINICNALISIYSDRALLPMPEVQVGQIATICTWAFVGEIIACPTVVFILDGFKRRKK